MFGVGNPECWAEYAVVAVVASQSRRREQRGMVGRVRLVMRKNVVVRPYRGIGNCRPVKMSSPTT